MTTAVSSLVKSHIAPMYFRILSKFPQNFTLCFGYGSGVKKQIGYDISDKKQAMIDLIYCVDNSYRWHATNLDMNPTHYSGLKFLGSNFIARFQEQFGAKVYFNTLIPFEEEGVLVKYGVVSRKDLVTDLLDWCDLYLAGRLHKPVEIIKTTNDPKLQSAVQLNLQSAVHASLLMLPETFTEYDLYYAISNLSYSGDFRMSFGENKNKITNIVTPQIKHFRTLYAPTLTLLHDFIDVPKECSEIRRCSQDMNPLTKLHHLNHLPKCPLKGIVKFWNKGHLPLDAEDVLRAVAYDPDCKEIVAQSMRDIVWQSSIRQSLKSILTAGIIKSFTYSGKKIMKMFD